MEAGITTAYAALADGKLYESGGCPIAEARLQSIADQLGTEVIQVKITTDAHSFVPDGERALDSAERSK